MTDVSGDGAEDGVFVIRSAGSGSYVSVVVLESNGAGYALRVLPDIGGVPGYMGHDRVEVRGKAIVRSFPTYIDRESVRIDQQWTPEDALSGKAPFKREADSNASPSGGDTELRFDYSANHWK